MLGAGLEPASLSAYAPQTYVSASSTTRASRGSKLSAYDSNWQVSSAFFLLILLLVLLLIIIIEIGATEVKVFEHEQEHEHD